MTKHSSGVMEAMAKRVEPKRVSITKAENGYMVSCYEKDGEYIMIAKDMEEAKKVMEKMIS